MEASALTEILKQKIAETNDIQSFKLLVKADAAVPASELTDLLKQVRAAGVLKFLWPPKLRPAEMIKFRYWFLAILSAMSIHVFAFGVYTIKYPHQLQTVPPMDEAGIEIDISMLDVTTLEKQQATAVAEKDSY